MSLLENPLLGIYTACIDFDLDSISMSFLLPKKETTIADYTMFKDFFKGNSYLGEISHHVIRKWLFSARNK